MALIKCFKCNEKISEHADMCPHCGCVYSKEMKKSIAYFNAAKYEYNLAVDIVRKIANISKKFNPLFSETLALKELDYCIQELLYFIAIKEGDFDSVKKYFLKNIVEYGDIFDDKIVEISILGGSNIDWDVAEKLPQNTQASILQLINKYVSSSVYTFIACAVMAEKYENNQNKEEPNKTLLYELEEKLIHIGLDVANAYGYSQDGITGYVCGSVDLVFGFAKRDLESKNLKDLLK